MDLFSGLGGASQAFVDAEDLVLRIENNPLLAEVPHTLNADVSSVESHSAIQNLGDIDLMWSSPPCLEFSNAFSAPGPCALRKGHTHFPSLDLLRQSVRMREDYAPRWFVIENVAGAARYFQPYIGKPTQIIGPYHLWGRFPHLQVDITGHSKYDGDPHSSDPLRSNKRALVPLTISEALREAMTHPTLEEFS